MKQHKPIVVLLLIVCITGYITGAIFNFKTPDKNASFPLTGFFRSMYARKQFSMHTWPIKASLEGYIVHEPFWDTRQVVNDAEGVYLYFPKRKNIDPLGKDINSIGDMNMAEIESRLRLSVYGPNIGKASSFGYIEVDFLGPFDLDNTLRNRLAYFSLAWKESGMRVMFGQFYNPARIAHLDLDTKVVAFNVAAPIHPDAFNPQLRITKKLGHHMHVLACAYTQLTQVSFGPEGESSVYLRRSLLPAFHAQLWASSDDKEYVYGVAGDIKRLIPRLVTDTCYTAHESITSCALHLFAKYTAGPVSIRNQLTWAQNGADYHFLGGYAVTSIDPITDHRTYTNIAFLSYWVDVNIDKKISPGILCGIAKNMSTNTCIIPSTINQCTGESQNLVYALGGDIHYMAKIMPRIRAHFKPVIFAAEVDWSWIRYGSFNDFGCPQQPTEDVSNVRILLATYFFF